MTVVVATKVYEGLVVGADSTSSIWETLNTTPNPTGRIVNTYDNANKIVNLHKKCPIGLATWGTGSIGKVSIAALAKDLRQRLMDGAGTPPFNEANFTVEAVAKLAKEFFYDEKFCAIHPDPATAPKSITGFLIFGLTTSAHHAEAWLFEITDGQCPDPSQIITQDAAGIWAFGDPSAVFRLLYGFDLDRMNGFLMSQKGMAEADAMKWIQELVPHLRAPMVAVDMPLQDTIDLTRYLVQATIDFHRFKLEVYSVGGPIDIATVTKHERFKWIQRKHFYSGELNREG